MPVKSTVPFCKSYFVKYLLIIGKFSTQRSDFYEYIFIVQKSFPSIVDFYTKSSIGTLSQCLLPLVASTRYRRFGNFSTIAQSQWIKALTYMHLLFLSICSLSIRYALIGSLRADELVSMMDRMLSRPIGLNPSLVSIQCTMRLQQLLAAVLKVTLRCL